MPRNKNRNGNFKKYKNYNNNNNNNFKAHNGGGNNFKNNHSKFQTRKIYLKPSQLEALEQNFDNAQTNSTEDYATNNRNFENRKNKKENRRRVVQDLNKMGIVKSSQPKLTIGEAESEIKKSLLQGRPHCKLNYIPDDVFNLIVSYVQNYFTCYDTNREGLLKAYNPKCTFSICLNMSNHAAHRAFRFEDSVVKESRNLKRLVGNEDYHKDKKFKLLHQGFLDTVSFLNKLPPTEHEPSSFKLDSCFFTQNMISFTVTGVCKEGKATDKVRPLRSFCRTFVCVPDVETQMNIINEHFIMSNVTTDQYKAYFQNENQKKPEETPQIETTQLSQPQPTLDGSLNQQQIMMIQQFSTESRLNQEWSKHCLEHANWNYEQAAKAFMEYRESIPKEAFLV